MIIDGIEYEDEPGFTDPETGKPVYYAKNVPQLLCGQFKENNRLESRFKYLNRMSDIKRLELGLEEWNEWIVLSHIFLDRWCEKTEEKSKLYIRLKEEGDSNYDNAKIDFSPERPNLHVPIKEGDFSGFVFPAEVSFRQATFVNAVNFEEMKFPKPVSFSKAAFKKDVKFGGTVFEEAVDFTGATMESEVSFRSTFFKKKVNFGEAEFKNSIDFHGLNALGGLDFSICKFGALVRFKDLIFHGYLNLSAASFSGQVDFQRVTFEESFYFNPSHVGGPVNFDEVTFNGDTRFGHGKFNMGLHINRSMFSDYVKFDQAEISGLLSFDECHFSRRVTFNEASIEGVAYFDKVTFEQSAHFQGTQFNKAVKWRNTVFFDSCRWDYAVFKQVAEYSQCQFVGRCHGVEVDENPFWTQCDVEFSGTSFEGYVSFDHVWFGKDGNTPKPTQYEDWDEIIRGKYNAATITSDSMTVPNFKGVIFEIAPNLGYTNVPDIPAPKWVWTWIKQKLMGRLLSRFWQQNVPDQNNMPPYAIKDGDAAAKLRVLGALAARGHHHLAEKRFFRAELLARRGWETKNGYEVAMINAFEKLSKCGLSFWRPMIALGALILISAGFYYSHINWPAGDRGPFELASYSFANSLPLLGYISDSYEVSVNVLFDGIDKVPGVVRVWAFAQNVVSAILIFFGLLAIRNYFKLG